MGIPYAVLVEVGSRGEPGRPLFEVRKQLFASILGDRLNTTYGPMRDPTAWINMIVFVEGEPTAVAVEGWPEPCRYLPNTLCKDDEIEVLNAVARGLGARRV